MSIINKITNIFPKKLALMLITLVIALGCVFGSVVYTSVNVFAESVLGSTNPTTTESNTIECSSSGPVEGCNYVAINVGRLNCAGGACADPISNSFYKSCVSKRIGQVRSTGGSRYNSYTITCTTKEAGVAHSQNDLDCIGGGKISDSNGSCQTVNYGLLSACVDIGNNWTYLCKQNATPANTSQMFKAEECNKIVSNQCQRGTLIGEVCKPYINPNGVISTTVWDCEKTRTASASADKVKPPEECDYNASNKTCVSKDKTKIYTDCEGTLPNIKCSKIPQIVIDAGADAKCTVGTTAGTGTCVTKDGKTLTGCTGTKCTGTADTKNIVNQTDKKNEDGVFAWIAKIVLGLLTLLLWLAVQFAKFALGVMGGMFVVLVSVNPASNELLNVAYRPWQSVVNIANVVLIAGIIFMGFGYILNLDFIKKSQGLQNFFLGILAVGVMMQFTFAASAAVVNFTNGIGNIIYFGAGRIAQPSVAPAGSELRICLDKIQAGGDSGIGFVNTFVCSVSQVSPILSAAEGSGDGLKKVFENIQGKGASNFVTTGIALAIFVLAIFSFWKVLVILLVRIFGLWMLIVVSPLALVAFFSPLPQMKDISSKWFDNFMRLSFSYPFYTFGITLVTLMIGSVSSALQEGAKKSRLGSLPDGSIDTYAQGVTGLGAAIGNITGKTVAFDDKLIVLIIIALFSLGLVDGFGILFTKIFGVIYDAVAKAAGTAMAVTRGTISAGKGAIGGAISTPRAILSGANSALKFATKGRVDVGDKIGSALNSAAQKGGLTGFAAKGLKMAGNTDKFLKGVSDAGFDLTRFAVDAPGGVINTAKKIYGGFKKSSDKTTQQNGQLISDYSERTMRRLGLDKEADLMDDPTYKGMGKDQFKDERWNKIADPKSFKNALMRYGIPPEWANNVADNFGKETQATRRQAKANRKRGAEYALDFEGLDDDDKIELLSDKAAIKGLEEGKSVEENLEKLKNISPEEYNVAKGIFESLADRPEVLAKMALDNRFKALAQTIYGGMTDDAKNKFKFSGMNLLGDKDVSDVLSSLSPSDKKKLEPSSLKDPRIKSIYEKFNSDYDSVLDKSVRFKQLDGSQTVSEDAFSMGNKSAKRAYADKVKGSNLDSALSAINRESKSLSSVNSNAVKDLFAVAYEHSEYDATTGKHIVTPAGDEVLKNSYKQMLTNQFGGVATDGNGNIDVSKIQNAQMSDLLATQAGSEIAAIYNSSFSDVDINSKEGEQLYKAMFHSVLSTTVNGQGEAIASAKLTADTLNDATRKSATENIVIDDAKKGMDSLHSTISGGADFDSAIQSLTQKLDVSSSVADRQNLLQNQGKAVAVESANAIAKAIARGETGVRTSDGTPNGGVIGDSMAPVITRAVQKVQSATNIDGAREAMAEVGQNIKTLSDQITSGTANGQKMSPTKLAELKATRAKLIAINKGVAQVIEVYHGNGALVADKTAVIASKVADEIKKTGQRFNVKTEDGSRLDKGKMQEVLANEKQKLTEKQKTNREKIRTSIPNDETVTSVFEVLRGAANSSVGSQGLRAKIDQNIGKDLLNKA